LLKNGDYNLIAGCRRPENRRFHINNTSHHGDLLKNEKDDEKD